jgi:serine/threonine protein phosphatase PrpC
MDEALSRFRLTSPAVTLTMTPPANSAALERPMRIAIASSGVSKDKFDFSTERWRVASLPNFAMLGEDTEAELRDDAVGVAHASTTYKNPQIPAATPLKTFARGNRTAVKPDALSSAGVVVRHPYAELSGGLTPEAEPFFAAGFTPAAVATEAAHTMSSVALAVSDGVGGMAGERDNDTPLMSHEIMRNVRRVLRPDSRSGKDVMSEAVNLMEAEGKPRVGACTCVVAVAAPHPTRADRLSLSFASLGDSVCAVFRPRIYASTETTEGDKQRPHSQSHAVPLAQSWPQDYGIQGNNSVPTPLQLTTSRGAPTSIPLDAEDCGIDPFSSATGPWLASEGSAELRRGDVVVLMTDGVSDNLRTHVFAQTLMEVYQTALMSSLRVEGLAKHPLARHGLYGPGAAALGAPAPGATGPETEAPRLVQSALDAEAVVAGNVAELFAGMLTRVAMEQPDGKVDDISSVVAIVY